MFFNRELLRKAFKETFEEYFQKTSLNGFGLLYYVRRKKYQRAIWFVSILCGCSFAIYVAFLYVTNFMQNPTVTAMSPFKERIFSKPFPAVSVCSANKISRIRAEEFAGELYRLMGHSPKHWLRKILLFAGYYEDNVSDLDDSIEFELELQDAFGEDYSIAQLLKSLAPTCEELMVECYFSRAQRNCSEIFKMVPTVVGYCCIFNRREEHVAKNFLETHYIFGVGYRQGLTLILNASTDDYFYQGRSMSGFLVHITEIHNLPDTSVGGVREIMVGPGTDVRVQLSILSQSADSQARRFSHTKRRCFFADENLGQEKLANSQSECLSRCRLQSQLGLCACVPYHTPQELLQGLSNVSVCSLMDLECMSAFYKTWRIYRPKELEDLMQQEALSCGECYPLCSFDHYYYQKESTKLRKTINIRKNLKFRSRLINNTDDFSLVRLYFQDMYAIKFDKKVLFNWFEIMSNIGGVLGISIGCSIISGFEILYFFVYRFVVNFLKLRKIHNKA